MCDEITSELFWEAREIEVGSDYTFDEARGSLERSLKYFMDCGASPDEAWDQARQLVALARYRAPDLGFGLRGAVDQLIFSVLHRAQRGVSL